MDQSSNQITPTSNNRTVESAFINKLKRSSTGDDEMISKIEGIEQTFFFGKVQKKTNVEHRAAFGAHQDVFDEPLIQLKKPGLAGNYPRLK